MRETDKIASVFFSRSKKHCRFFSISLYFIFAHQINHNNTPSVPSNTICSMTTTAPKFMTPQQVYNHRNMQGLGKFTEMITRADSAKKVVFCE
jgi:hypothetical protein